QAAVVELFILYDEWQLAFAGGQVQGLLFIVFYDKKAAQSPVYLRTCELVRMRMIPVGSSPLVHIEPVVIVLSGLDGIFGMSIHIGRHDEPVPVKDTFLVHAVLKVDIQRLTPLDPYRRAWQRAIKHVEIRGRITGQYFLSGFGRQFEVIGSDLFRKSQRLAESTLGQQKALFGFRAACQQCRRKNCCPAAIAEISQKFFAIHTDLLLKLNFFTPTNPASFI